MACYQGNKRKFAFNLVKIMNAIVPNETIQYFEPFCGGCSVAKAMYESKPNRPMHLSDYNNNLILLLKFIAETGALPVLDATIDPVVYKSFMLNETPSPERAAIGLINSKNCNWFAAQEDDLDEICKRRRGWLSLSNMLKHAKSIDHLSYSKVNLPTQSCLIYCDPPYFSSQGYKAVGGVFDSARFWRIANEWADVHHVFVSEFCNRDTPVPKDWDIVWCQQRGVLGKVEMECLFYKGPSSKTFLSRCDPLSALFSNPTDVATISNPSRIGGYLKRGLVNQLYPISRIRASAFVDISSVLSKKRAKKK